MHVDRIFHAPLLGGQAGVEQTLSRMAELVREGANDLDVRNTALEITGDIAGHDFEGEVAALFDFCRDRIVYRRDPVEQERVQDAKRTLFVFGTGDCDDKVVCLATLLATLGHKSRFKVLGTKRGHFSHVYLEVQTPRGWLSLDPTPEQAHAGWQGRGHMATYEIFPTAGAGSVCFLAGAALLLYWFLR